MREGWGRVAERQRRLSAAPFGAASTGSAVSTSKERMVPLSAFSRFGAGNTPIAVYHDNLFAASTISFDQAAKLRGRKYRCGG
jgi:hypothetical protein